MNPRIENGWARDDCGQLEPYVPLPSQSPGIVYFGCRECFQTYWFDLSAFNGAFSAATAEMAQKGI